MDAYKQFSNTENGLLVPLVEATCYQHGITATDLITVAEKGMPAACAFAQDLDLPQDAVAKSLDEIRHVTRQSPRMYRHVSSVVATGLLELDVQLGGGIQRGEITEVIGAAGTAKLHFAMQMALQCQAESTRESIVKCIYITTETVLETRRLVKMLPRYHSINPLVLMDNIYYTYCSTPDSMDIALYTQIPILLKQQRNVHLLVIDSIAQHIGQGESLSRSRALRDQIETQDSDPNADSLEYGVQQTNNAAQLRKCINRLFRYQVRQAKQEYMVRMHRHLAQVAKENNVAILLVNHVSDLVSESTGEYTDPLDINLQQAIHSGWDIGPMTRQFTARQNWYEEHEIGQYVAHLGLTWSKRITNRILFTKFYCMNNSEDNFCMEGKDKEGDQAQVSKSTHEENMERKSKEQAVGNFQAEGNRSDRLECEREGIWSENSPRYESMEISNAIHPSSQDKDYHIGDKRPSHVFTPKYKPENTKGHHHNHNDGMNGQCTQQFEQMKDETSQEPSHFELYTVSRYVKVVSSAHTLEAQSEKISIELMLDGLRTKIN